MKQTEFRFKLTTPIKYQGKVGEGKYDFLECKELILQAPSLRPHRRICNTLQSLFTPMMLSSNKNLQKIKSDVSIEKVQKEEEEVELTAQMINIIFFSSGNDGLDINSYYDAFERLLLCGKICFLDETTEITEIELNDILDNNYSDFKSLIAEYTANFFIASWMNELMMRG